MIDPAHELPISKQAKALGISRGSVYYVPKPVPAVDLAIMRRIDELHLNYPFAGSRMMAALLANQGVDVGRRHVRTLMKKMGIEAIYRKPNTSKPAAGHKVYPYLLRKLKVERPNQVWATDITYIPMAKGFVYLTAVVDWFTRRVLTWRLSITMEAEFCVEALQESSGPLRQAGDPQYGSGLTVHVGRLHLGAHRGRCQDQHGRQGVLAGQRLRRAALALDQIRGGLPPRLLHGRRGPHIDRPIHPLVQRFTSSLEP